MIVGVPAKTIIEAQVVGAKSGPAVDSERVRQAQLFWPVGEIGQRPLILERSVNTNQQFVQKRVRHRAVVVRGKIVNLGIASRSSRTICRADRVREHPPVHSVISRAAGVSHRENVFIREVLVAFNREVRLLGSIRIEFDQVRAQVRIRVSKRTSSYGSQCFGRLANSIGGDAIPRATSEGAKRLPHAVGVGGQGVVNGDWVSR